MAKSKGVYWTGEECTSGPLLTVCRVLLQEKEAVGGVKVAAHRETTRQQSKLWPPWVLTSVCVKKNNYFRCVFI